MKTFKTEEIAYCVIPNLGVFKCYIARPTKEENIYYIVVRIEPSKEFNQGITFEMRKSSDLLFTNINDAIAHFKAVSKLNGNDDTQIIDQIIKGADQIKHCGDYGYLYWNPTEKTVWYTGGDGDFQEDEGYTGIEEAKLLLKPEGVDEVIIEAETGPEILNEEDDDKLPTGWVDLGQHGIII